MGAGFSRPGTASFLSSEFDTITESGVCVYDPGGTRTATSHTVGSAGAGLAIVPRPRQDGASGQVPAGATSLRRTDLSVTLNSWILV